jgi:hypothetical protein
MLKRCLDFPHMTVWFRFCVLGRCLQLIPWAAASSFANEALRQLSVAQPKLYLVLLYFDYFGTVYSSAVCIKR